MTTYRRYGEDTPFGKWVREQKLLDSHQFSFTVNDADWMFHKFATRLNGGSTRDLQLMMFVELKTNAQEPNRSQHETLFFLHQLLKNKLRLKKPGGARVAVWHYGVFVLSLLSDHPSDVGDRWGRFSESGELCWSPIANKNTLIDLLGFGIDPVTLVRVDTRLHHKSNKLTRQIETEIGLLTEETIWSRS